MSAENFIDTNLFIYPLERLDIKKSDIAEKIIKEGIKTGNACISFQVVQECLNTIARKAEIPFNHEDTRNYLTSILTPLFRIPASINLYHRCLSIRDRYHYGFYDSLIIAAALEGKCTRLYSEDLQHGQKIENTTIENPFI